MICIPKVIKVGKEFAVTITDELAKRLDLREGTPVHMFEVTAGTIAFERVKSSFTLTADDIAMLKKLLQFKFEERTPDHIDNAFAPAEKKRLSDMIKKGLVNLYYGGKYSSSGVYNVPTRVYQQYIQQTLQQTVPSELGKTSLVFPTVSSQAASKSSIPAKPSAMKLSVPVKLTPIQQLEKNGFLVMQSEADAKEFSDAFSGRIRKKEIFGVRGFDKKYYIVKSSFITKNEGKVRAFLKNGAKSSDKIAEALDIEPQGAVALLTIMNEEGELIEKRRGIFALAD